MALGKIPRFSPSFSPAELFVVARTLAKSNEDIPTIERFEHEFAHYIGFDHAVMVPSARFGFSLLLAGLGLKPDDEVIMPALTYWAIPAMALAMGVRPVFADIGLNTHVLDPESFEARITDKTKAVVPTHLFGTPCDMDAINAIAQKHGIKVIEDTAQATGARYKGKRVGGLGDAAYFTFGLTKNMTTLSGAMVATSDADLARYLREQMDACTPAPLKNAMKETLTGTAMMVATHPWVYPFTVHPAVVLGNRLGKDPIHERFGEAEKRYDSVPAYYRTARPRAVQAAVGLKQLERLEGLNGARIRNGRFLDDQLGNVPGLMVPEYPEGAEPIYMSFVVHHEDRDALAAALRARGVDTTIGYMGNCADHPLFPEVRNDCPNASEAFDKLLHIPVHPNLKQKDLNHMVESIRAACLEVGNS